MVNEIELTHPHETQKADTEVTDSCPQQNKTSAETPTPGSEDPCHKDTVHKDESMIGQPAPLPLQPETSATKHCVSAATAATQESEADSPLPLVQEILRHGEHVGDLAALLFDALEPLHHLPEEWRRRLILAAQLHDIGLVEGCHAHHKVSMRMILADQRWQMEEKDRTLVALLARYHRKAWPSMKHKQFAALDKTNQLALRQCAVMLRVVDGLDYSRRGCVCHLDILCKRHSVTLICKKATECQTEELQPDIQRSMHEAPYFKKIFSRELRCQIL